MKSIKHKYWSFKTVSVLFLLVSFNIVLVGKDLHNCICHTEKAETKKSCCKKDENTCEKPAEKSCCSKTAEKECDNCSSCKFEKGGSDNDGLISDDKIVKTEIKKSVKTEYISKNTNQNTDIVYTGERANLSGSKLFLSISNLRI